MQNTNKINVFFYLNDRDLERNFETSRLRRNFKSGLELNNYHYNNSPVDDTIQIVQYLNYKEYAKFNYFKGKFLIKGCALFYNECDADGKMLLKYKRKDQEVETYQIKENLRVDLSLFDFILVPSSELKELLIKEGIKSKIYVVLPGVKLTKLELKNSYINNVAKIYFHFDDKTKYFYTVIDHTDVDAATRMIELAKTFPEYRFVVIINNLNSKEGKKVKKIFKNYPFNISLTGILEEDIYYSLVYNSSGFINLNSSKTLCEETLEAYAAKKTVFALKSSIYNDLIIDKETGYVYNDFASLIKGINSFTKEELKPLGDNAYKFANENTVKNIGLKLINIYKDIL